MNTLLTSGSHHQRRIQLLFLIMFYSMSMLFSQSYFSRVYKVPEDGTGLENIWPNYLKAVLPTDSLIFAIGYSADTTYKEIYGTAFYTFSLEGDLLDYYHIKDNDNTNFFDPEGIHSYDGITFYTAFNNFYISESILKFNRFTRQQEVFYIYNSLNSTDRDILFNNFKGDNQGNLYTASLVATGREKEGKLVQVTKIDTTGKIKWQKILGKDPNNYYYNSCWGQFIDDSGNIYVGVGYQYLGDYYQKPYESLLYKLDSNGKQIGLYNSDPKKGFHDIYDIALGKNNSIYLSSTYNYNTIEPPYGNEGFGIIQVLNSKLKLIDTISLDLRPNKKNGGDAYLHAFKKILIDTLNSKIITGGVSFERDTFYFLDTSQNKIDTIKGLRRQITLLSYGINKKLLWRRNFRIRNYKDLGTLYDMKFDPFGNIVIAAESYKGDAYEANKEAYFQPWLLKLDSDGCLVPGCGSVGSIDHNTKPKVEIKLYPIPCTDYISISHNSTHCLLYTITDYQGKILDQFLSCDENEQIIFQTRHLPAGNYYVKACVSSGNCNTTTFLVAK